MKKAIVILLLVAAVSLTACGAKTPDAAARLPLATYLTDGEILDEVRASLERNGLENTGVYKEWVQDFADTAAAKAGLTDRWVAPAELKGDPYACADRWEKSHDYSDANCRMTAKLLMGDLLTVAQPQTEYTGTYLMMDVDAIENADRYQILKDREADFTTLFGEMDIPDGGLADALPQNWKERGIRFDSQNVSLISVVMEDTMSPVAFVGHTGLLIDEGKDLLFVEKIAFEQPYQATKLNSIDELVAMLSARPEYAAEEGKEPSVICRNDTVIGRITADNTAAA